MISADQAQRLILDAAHPLGTEEVSLAGSLYRYLASRVTAPISLPPFDHSAMDGFAVKGSATQKATREKPLAFTVVGTIPAGDSRGGWLGSDARPGNAFRIMTGAPIPEGTDSVVPLEEVQEEGDLIFLSSPVPPGVNVRTTGEDVRSGEVVFEKGERITSRVIALLAALGLDRVPVSKRPRVKVLATGNELEDPGRSLGPGRIYNSNLPAIVAALRELEIQPAGTERVGDTAEEISGAIDRLGDADVLITLGGVSTGDYDLVPSVLRRKGVQELFHKVSVKPGKPLYFGILKGTLVFGLPGNPVSAMTSFQRFVRPALLKILGGRRFLPERRLAVAEETFLGSEGKEVCLRGIVEMRDGRYFVRGAGRQGSADLLPLARANALVILPPERVRIDSGEPVVFEYLQEEP